MTALICLASTVCLTACGYVDERLAPPLSADEVAALEKKLDDQIAQLSEQLKKSADRIALLSARGDAYFFRARFAEAVADFDRMVELNPELAKSHWRRGIAYYYADRYDDAAKQFETYHSHDNIDRENGIWRFLSQAKAKDVAFARKAMLRYQQDDRAPFGLIYPIFAGTKQPADAIAAVENSALDEADRERQLFYAQLYGGLFHAANSDERKAQAHLALAVKNSWGKKADGGPGWMWHVARVHEAQLREKLNRARGNSTIRPAMK